MSSKIKVFNVSHPLELSLLKSLIPNPLLSHFSAHSLLDLSGTCLPAVGPSGEGGGGGGGGGGEGEEAGCYVQNLKQDRLLYI